MIYIDLTPGEIEKLTAFHEAHPAEVVRVFSDELVNEKTGEYRKLVRSTSGATENIADISIY
jgi:hypothetical protein